MPVTTSVRALTLQESESYVREGAAFVDLRPVREYLEVHVPGSIALGYEGAGPGLPSRARDCIPLEVPLVLLGDDRYDMAAVAGALRGKGFTVQGFVPDGLRAWGERNGAPASSEVHEGDAVPEGTVVDVGDPGVRRVEDATLLSVERMWTEAHRLADREPVVILAGRGVRAAMAIGMLERAGIERIVFWKRS